MTNILQKKMAIEGKLLSGGTKLDSSLLFVAVLNEALQELKTNI